MHNTHTNLYSVSFQQNCNTAAILDQAEVLAPTLPDFLNNLRTNKPLFTTLSIPTINNAGSHGQLPTIVYSGLYSTRSASGLTSWNGIVALDIDPLKELKTAKSSDFFEEEIDKVTDLLRESDLKPYGFNRSKSGKGLRLLYAVNPQAYAYSDVAQYYSDLYMSLATVVLNALHTQDITCFHIDDQAKDIAHPFAIVQDQFAEHLGSVIPNDTLHKLLKDYTVSKAKNSGNVTYTIDLGEFKLTVPIADFRLKPGVSLTDHQTTFTIANIISYLFGVDGKPLYKSLLKRDNKKQFRQAWMGYYTTGLRNAAKNDASYVEQLTRSISYYTDNKVKKNYSYLGQANNTVTYSLNIGNQFMPGLRGVLHIDKYLTEREKSIVWAIKRYKKIVLKSDTGTGKTTLMKRLVHHFPGEKIDMIAPTLSIVQQQDIIQVTGAKRLTQDQCSAKIIATTYASINKLEEREATILVIDEAHHLLEDFTKDFREENIKDIMNAISRYEHVVLCTGTAHNLAFNGFKMIEVEKHKPEVLTLVEGTELVNFINLADELKTIYVTNRETGEELIKVALRHGYKSNEVAFLHSQVKHDQVYQSIVKEQVLPQELRLLITTKLLCDGVNINNAYDKVNILFYPSRKDVLSFNEIKQYSARFRKAKDVALHIRAYHPRPITEKNIPTLRNLQYRAALQNNAVNSGEWMTWDNQYCAGSDNVKAIGRTVEYIYLNAVSGKHEVSEVQYWRQHQIRLNTLFRNDLIVRTKVLTELGITLVQGGTIHLITKQKEHYVAEKNINKVVIDRGKEKRENDRQNIKTILEVHTLITDRYHKKLLSQYNEMVSNCFDKEKVVEIIMGNSEVKIASMIKTSRYLHNYKTLKKGVTPRVGTNLALNDVAMIALYIQVSLFVERENINKFNPKDEGFANTVNGLARTINKRFKSSLSTSMSGETITNIMLVLYRLGNTTTVINGELVKIYNIKNPYKIEQFRKAKSIKIPTHFDLNDVFK